MSGPAWQWWVGAEAAVREDGEYGIDACATREAAIAAGLGETPAGGRFCIVEAQEGDGSADDDWVTFAATRNAETIAVVQGAALSAIDVVPSGRLSVRCSGLVCHIGAVTGRGCSGNDPCPLTTLAERGILAFPLSTSTPARTPRPVIDRRPIADSLEGCFRCGVSGRHGCAHQRPMVDG